MKWHEIPDGCQVFEVLVKVDSAQLGTLAVPELEVSTNPGGHWFVASDGAPVPVKPVGRNAEDVLRVLLANPDRALTQAFDAGGELRIEARVFSGRVRLDRPLRLILPPEWQERLPATARGRPDDWFQDQFGYRGSYFVHTGGQTFDPKNGFELRGREWRLSVQPAEGRLVVGKVSRWKRGIDLTCLDAPIVLVPEEFERAAEALETESSVAFDESRFLDVWARYQEAERKFLAEKAARLGKLAYSTCYRDGSTVAFVLEADVPLAWRSEDDRFSVCASDGRGGRSVPIGKIVRLDARLVITEMTSEILPPSGFLAPDELGDRRRLERRDAALKTLRSQNTQMPDLLQVLEGNGRTTRRGKQHRWPSQGVLESLGGRQLTTAQSFAVDVALNTPDLALIQGPPGTGKTTVIRVLAQRLNELGHSPVLLTSYQHDAVLRALEGVVVGGVPGIRLGGRRDEAPGLALRPLGEWLARVRAHSTASFLASGVEPAWGAIARRAGQHFGAWALEPGGLPGTRAVIGEFRRLLGGKVPAEFMVHLDAAEAALEPPPVPETLDDVTRQDILRLVDGQALTSEAFADGGDLKARRLLAALRGKPILLSDAVQRTLAAAAVEADAPPVEFRGALDAVRAAVAPPPTEHQHDPVAAARPHLEAVMGWVTAESGRRGGSLADALQVFLDLLEERGVSLPALLARYAPAIGATLQQAVIDEVSDLHTQFDTVIVDEAARANPLDLLIPLVLARRIILVGDQNQLPHMLEPALEAAVESGAVGTVADILRESLFGRLWSLYDSAPPGGIRRTVPLDVQFRMHPRIGRFISNTFYGGALTDGVTAADRDHGTTLFDGHPIAWFDVRRGHESGRYERVVEIDRAADLVRSILDEAPQASVGVITFYKRQAELLRERQRLLGWPDRVEVGTVDAFQGKEFDFVILSTVRSGGGIGFLRMPNRLNVAMSRGRRALVVVGDASTVRQVPQLDTFLELCRNEGHYVRA